MGFIRVAGEFLAGIAGFMLVWFTFHHFLSLEVMVQMNNFTYRLKQLMWSLIVGFSFFLIAYTYLEPSTQGNIKQINNVPSSSTGSSPKSNGETLSTPLDLSNDSKPNTPSEQRVSESEPPISSDK